MKGLDEAKKLWSPFMGYKARAEIRYEELKRKAAELVQTVGTETESKRLRREDKRDDAARMLNKKSYNQAQTLYNDLINDPNATTEEKAKDQAQLKAIDTALAEYAALLRDDFASFAAYCFRELNPRTRFALNWHVEVMAGQLAAVRDGRIRWLLVCVPQRCEAFEASVALIEDKASGTQLIQDLRMTGFMRSSRIAHLQGQTKRCVCTRFQHILKPARFTFRFQHIGLRNIVVSFSPFQEPSTMTKSTPPRRPLSTRGLLVQFMMCSNAAWKESLSIQIR